MSIADCRIVDLPRLSDDRGSLTFVEAGAHVPFDIRRVYFLYEVPSLAERGAHGHRALEQLIIAVAGGFDVLIDDGEAQRSVRLDRPDRGLLVAPMIWRELRAFAPGSVCLVLASLPYDEADYFRDRESFLLAARQERGALRLSTIE